ncbi:hypothetical protein PHO31112_03956 [Pandoraea horticolens]|uniref:Transposase n=1 Tax=Pandoraea horticolens TaxID=2508298 RepID=A0A5E4XMK8_9BURK|nr:hypothetical protein PHO31112_03956 [Pandoraea horticolens]
MKPTSLLLKKVTRLATNVAYCVGQLVTFSGLLKERFMQVRLAQYAR